MKIITFLICLLIPFVSFAAQIKVYTMDGCDYCHQLKQELNSRHIPFTEISGGQKYDSFPVTEVNGTVIRGDDIDAILRLVKSKNK